MQASQWVKMQVSQISHWTKGGYWTLQYQDTSVSNHFGTSVLGPKCPDQLGISAEVSPDTSASVPKCLQPLWH